MSDRSHSLLGTVAQGARSWSRAVLIGTSAAAPLAARQMVRNLADEKPVFTGVVPRQPEPADEPEKEAYLQARLGDGFIPATRRG